MLNSTIDAIKAVLRTDETVSPRDRSRAMASFRNEASAAKPETTTARVARIIRRGEAADRLSCSLRTVDKLAATGVLKKRKLPGRVRASGFLESEVAALIEADATR
jgi:hypothetical protein